MTMDGAGGSLEQQIHDLRRTVEAGFAQMVAGFARTDERFLDFEKRMEAGFAHTDARFREFEQRMDARFARVDGQFTEIGRDMASLLGMIRKNTEDISTIVTKVDTLTTRVDESGARLERVERMLTATVEQQALAQKQLADHESRIRALEKV